MPSAATHTVDFLSYKSFGHADYTLVFAETSLGMALDAVGDDAANSVIAPELAPASEPVGLGGPEFVATPLPGRAGDLVGAREALKRP
ncbi:hypothetical protein [Chenggangzhangella methanolivorans]|uniref:Uncharacterized protein n=1 Tax=Chenggangzhangella methanolivorans TaxID=1437009 RepID=A0A9E6UHC3_9HYPH|nr:hypothetical protein [Chenggangzhangella methanolivorans]QZN99642.1 hypothetical protein K6K41_23580 [Chenggangzhangella methanolivorans]